MCILELEIFVRQPVRLFPVEALSLINGKQSRMKANHTFYGYRLILYAHCLCHGDHPTGFFVTYIQGGNSDLNFFCIKCGGKSDLS